MSNNTEIVQINNFKIACRPNTGDFEIAMSSIYHDEYHLLKFVKAGGLFVDVGAYGGHVSLLAASLGMRCIAIEPLPENIENIQENIRLNGFENHITIVCGAIGETTIYWEEDDRVKSRFVANGWPQLKGNNYSTKIEAPLINLDELLKKFPIVDILKVDCEGGEWSLPFAKETMAKTKRIVGEFHPIDERNYDDFAKLFLEHKDVSEVEGDGPKEGTPLRVFVFELN